MATSPSRRRGAASASAASASTAFDGNASEGSGSNSNNPALGAHALEQPIGADQALAAIALSLLQRRTANGSEPAWIWDGEADGAAGDLQELRQRLEVIQLAIATAAPLTTAEVTRLLGARPGAAEVERGGLTARRLGRNIWTLSRRGEGHERSRSVVQFSEGFRRRL